MYKDGGAWNWSTYLPLVLELGITWATPPLSHRLHGMQMDTLVQGSEFEERKIFIPPPPKEI